LPLFQDINQHFNGRKNFVAKMEASDKIDHKMEFVDDHSNGTALSRQVTVTMSPEQYERLFFQPSAPVRGDYAKRFANPTLLGLLGFLIPYTSTIFTLQGWAGTTPPTSKWF
jgi:hypothetical protein